MPVNVAGIVFLYKIQKDAGTDREPANTSGCG